jgi:hypothetical protein
VGTKSDLVKENMTLARTLWGQLPPLVMNVLEELTNKHRLRLSAGDLIFLDTKWYVTNSGLLGIACRKRCRGIRVHALKQFCSPVKSRWAFKATVFTSSKCCGFSGYGDADPSNVSPRVHGAEMRVAETRAVNRALRKAYGIGICSIEEIGSFEKPSSPERAVRKLPPESSNGNNGHGGNGHGTRVRDRLCQLIRQHKLDAELVKSYAIDFCGTKSLREAAREQVENFVAHLADWAAKDRNALLCQLNSYVRDKEGAA